MQPIVLSSADFEDWQEVALVLQNSFNKFLTEQVRQGTHGETHLLTVELVCRYRAAVGFSKGNLCTA